MDMVAKSELQKKEEKLEHLRRQRLLQDLQ